MNRLRSTLAGLRELVAYAIWLAVSYRPFAGADDIEGTRGTGNISANVLEVDFSSEIVELDKDINPLVSLTMRAKRERAKNPKFTWFEDEPETRHDRVNDATPPVAAATAVTVDNGLLFHPDDLVLVTRTSEVFRVVTRVANDLTVIVRGIGSTAADFLDDDELIIIGSAAEEGAADKAAHTPNPGEVFNYTQIFRDPVDETDTARATENRVTPHDWDRARRLKAAEHKKDLERALMLGRPSLSTAGTHPRRTTGGFDYYATENITGVGGTMTEAEFVAAVDLPFRHGSKTKLAVSGRLPGNVAQSFARAKVQIEQSERTFGIRVVNVITQHGQISFLTHDLMIGDRLSGEIWIIDLPNMGTKYLANGALDRSTRWKENIQAPGVDARKDELITEQGYVFGQPKTHGKVTGITG